MIVPRYRIAASNIAGAGQGLFLLEDVAAGQIVTAPDAIDRTYRYDELTGSPELSAQLYASARWFEDRYTVSPDWPDECYINHSFAPTGLWHLGFVFAARDLPAGTEMTVDYRHLLPPGEEEAFVDAATGQRIVGLPWIESLRTSTHALASLLDGTRLAC
ncbi:SET domain-containing protein [Dyella jiangningensis]|uniref:SET domain-containing protein n=1 Tax=Dyella sp. AtDHG13 TaxID=1938897 RepID=UPI00088FD0FC|nr:SET domain-containing protein [Dyella sp. AtDHG13]PXV58328.1 SET domain-containing protein [Dyella sp. AtDHG13]SDK06975.1 SET domain-containing protein [Dyella jiangningensis]